jgi:hypothetical protein
MYKRQMAGSFFLEKEHKEQKKMHRPARVVQSTPQEFWAPEHQAIGRMRTPLDEFSFGHAYSQPSHVAPFSSTQQHGHIFKRKAYMNDPNQSRK